ncbi:hypothetical protein, conserved [Eimeria brunetti]|uniref:Uncharacterized protein n=1 Tax=Eimeria brunetti TaxID=51314 RepID=U6LIR3_9EIME|nr:hypothetical protein, conserved [Eimeria brunetti]
MSLSPTFAGGAPPLSEYLELQGPSGAAAASSIHKTVFSYEPPTLVDTEHLGPPALLNPSTLARPALRLALVAAVLVAVFLVLRCVYYISATSSPSRGTKGRRIAGHGWTNPCDPLQQGQRQPQQRQQEAAGAAAARPEAVAGPSRAEQRPPPLPPRHPLYFSATPLDLMSLFEKSTMMSTWLVQAEAAESELLAGGKPEGSDFTDMMAEGVRIVDSLKVISFSGEVRADERSGFMNTLGQCKATLRRLFQRAESSWVGDCEAQTEILNTGIGSASSHLGRMHHRHPIHPGDPALETMKKLRRAADAAAEAWIRHLREQHQVFQRRGGGDEAKQRLAHETSAGKAVREELVLIAGKALSK